MPKLRARLHSDEALEDLRSKGKGLGRREHRKPQQQNYMIRQLLTAEERAEELPPYKYWPGREVLDQGNTGTCVGHAVAHRWEDSPMGHSGQIDPYLLYRWAADRDPWEQNNGLTENDPHSDERYDWGTSADACASALLDAEFIDSFWWEIGSSAFETIKRWVLLNGSVCIGTAWWPSLYNPRWTEVADGERRWALVLDEAEGDIVGGHELVIDGWRTFPGGIEVPRLKNSWGPWWGVNGRAAVESESFRRMVDTADFVLLQEKK